MSAVATPTYPASRPDHSLDGKVVLPGDARYDDAATVPSLFAGGKHNGPGLQVGSRR
jgi:hypothetical protein